MGEKIRDVKPIQLIGSDLMVELNEGYTKSQGRVIHIQNKKFRYLLTEKDFYKVSSDIMRAAVEFEYIKTHLPVCDIKIPAFAAEATDVSAFALPVSCEQQNIDYRILEVRNELMTLVIHPQEYKRFRKMAGKEKYVRLEHPFGKRHGYKFLYQMQPFEIYEKDGLYYEIMCQIPCKSLTPKMWMPVDKIVQTALWDTVTVTDGKKFADIEQRWIFMLMRVMFSQIGFSKRDKDFFEQYKEVLEREQLKEKLDLIVFGFADQLIALMKESRYEEVISAYFSFRSY